MLIVIVCDYISFIDMCDCDANSFTRQSTTYQLGMPVFDFKHRFSVSRFWLLLFLAILQTFYSDFWSARMIQVTLCLRWSFCSTEHLKILATENKKALIPGRKFISPVPLRVQPHEHKFVPLRVVPHKHSDAKLPIGVENQQHINEFIHREKIPPSGFSSIELPANPSCQSIRLTEFSPLDHLSSACILHVPSFGTCLTEENVVKFDKYSVELLSFQSVTSLTSFHSKKFSHLCMCRFSMFSNGGADVIDSQSPVSFLVENFCQFEKWRKWPSNPICPCQQEDFLLSSHVGSIGSLPSKCWNVEQLELIPSGISQKILNSCSEFRQTFSIQSVAVEEISTHLFADCSMLQRRQSRVGEIWYVMLWLSFILLLLSLVHMKYLCVEFAYVSMKSVEFRNCCFYILFSWALCFAPDLMLIAIICDYISFIDMCDCNANSFARNWTRQLD